MFCIFSLIQCVTTLRIMFYNTKSLLLSELVILTGHC